MRCWGAYLPPGVSGQATACCLPWQRLSCILVREVNVNGSQRGSIGPADKAGLFPRRAGRKALCHPPGGVSMGDGGDPSRAGNPPAPFRLYDVSINTLLGSPRRLVCQCCGMPLEDDGVLSREPDGSFNEDYCKWCYTGGKFVYSSLEELIEFLAGTMATAEWPPEQVRAYLRARLPGLGHWKGK